MFVSPYDTKAGSGLGHRISKIADQIERELTIGTDNYLPINGETNCYTVTPRDNVLPPFAHPIEVNGKQGSIFIVDVRGFTRLDINQNVVISSVLDHSVSTERCILQQRWVLDGAKRIFDLGMFQVEAFGRWISSGLRARYTLDPEAAMRVGVAASFYYYCMCDDSTDVEYSDEDMINIGSIIGRSYGLSAQETVDILGEPLVCKDINGLIRLIKFTSGSIRLERLTIADLFTMYGGTWFGANAREVVAIALEHPPTFVVLIKHAMTERGFRNSMLSQVLKPLEKNTITHAFLKNYDYLLHSK